MYQALQPLLLETKNRTEAQQSAAAIAQQGQAGLSQLPDQAGNLVSHQIEAPLAWGGTASVTRQVRRVEGDVWRQKRP